jgi:hypothetical protein
MSNQFVKKLTVSVGNEDATVYTTGGTTRSTVIGVNIANTAATDIIVSLKFYDNSTETTGYIVKDVVVPVSTSLVAIGGDQKLVLEPADSLVVVTDTPVSADVIVSALEITT